MLIVRPWRITCHHIYDDLLDWIIKAESDFAFGIGPLTEESSGVVEAQKGEQTT
jgi:hypothetical protein